MWSAPDRAAHPELVFSYGRPHIVIMRTKTQGQAVALARRLGAREGQKRSFASGLFAGLGAASLMIAGELPRPKMPSGTVRDDWRAVMNDISIATRKRVSETT
jgi:hypothetical protein